VTSFVCCFYSFVISWSASTIMILYPSTFVDGPRLTTLLFFQSSKTTYVTIQLVNQRAHRISVKLNSYNIEFALVY